MVFGNVSREVAVFSNTIFRCVEIEKPNFPSRTAINQFPPVITSLNRNMYKSYTRFCTEAIEGAERLYYTYGNSNVLRKF